MRRRLKAEQKDGPGTSAPRHRIELEEARERTRRWIAIVLFTPLSVGLLVAIAGLAFGSLNISDLKELFASLNLGTLIVGAASFYFGRRTARR